MTESLRVNTLVKYDGLVEWLPPSLFKSTCTISVSRWTAVCCYCLSSCYAWFIAPNFFYL